MTFSYIEKCKNIISGIDPETLASMTPGKEIGRGSAFAFRPIGKIAIAETAEIYVGIKTPTKGRDADTRLQNELAFISFVTQHSPELIPKVPFFMGLVCLEGSRDPFAFITEDASQGGKKRVTDISASREVRNAIYEPFRELGTYDELISDEECDNTLAFSVDGEVERLLDFTPPPLNDIIHNFPAYKTARFAALDAIPELTITIPAGSRLSK